MKAFFSELGRDIWDVSYTLFKLMIPVIIIVKVLEEMGAIEYISLLLGPLMGVVGLPESMGLVWATTILTNIYAGMLVFFYAQQTEMLTVAQVTVIAILLLLAHGLPVEARIAQQAGIRLRVTLLLRIGGGFLFGWIAHLIMTHFNLLQEPNQLVWEPALPEPGLWPWFVGQLESLVMIQLIIIVLLTALKILKVVGIERLMGLMLRPVLKFLGIGREATTITIVGVTLGLAFGGGLLIKEARAGHVPKKDIFASMSLLGLCHSMIEDTLLVLVLGADFFWVFWFRMLLALLIVAVLTRVVNRLPDAIWSKHLVNRHIEPLQPAANT